MKDKDVGTEFISMEKKKYSLLFLMLLAPALINDPTKMKSIIFTTYLLRTLNFTVNLNRRQKVKTKVFNPL